jgi:hypothetical protein
MDSEDKLQRTVEGQMDMQEAATELLRISPHYGPVVLADSFFGHAGTVFGMPHLDKLLPVLRQNFFPAWERYRNAIRSADHRNEFDKLSAGPVSTIEQIVGPIETKKANTEEETNSD